VFFVFFDAPSVSQFRQQLGLDPAALSPVLFIAGAEQISTVGCHSV
jgi:hypothetical protein